MEAGGGPKTLKKFEYHLQMVPGSKPAFTLTSAFISKFAYEISPGQKKSAIECTVKLVLAMKFKT